MDGARRAAVARWTARRGAPSRRGSPLGGALGPGAAVGETSFLSGAERACDVKTGDAKAGVLLLVMSRVGFLKAMKLCPHVAAKLLWNLATGLSYKFTLRNIKLRELNVTLEAQRAKSRRQEETAQLRDAASKLGALVRGGKAVYGASGRIAATAPPGEGATARVPASAAPAAPEERPRMPIRASSSWEVAFSEGLSTFARLETRVLHAGGSRAAGAAGGSTSIKGSVSSAALPRKAAELTSAVKGAARSHTSLPVVAEGSK